MSTSFRLGAVNSVVNTQIPASPVFNSQVAVARFRRALPPALWGLKRDMGTNKTNLKQLLTPSALRRAAGARSFERGVGYCNGKQVRSIAEQENSITAKVAGTHVYRVRLWVEKNNLDYSCTCPLGEDGEFCKHCVAVGLAWLQQEAANADTTCAVLAGKAKSSKPAVTMQDARRYLAAQETTVLVDLLMKHAERDENLQRSLLMLAAKRTKRGLDLATYRQAIEDAVIPDEFVRYNDMYDYSRRADQVIDSLEDLLKEGHADSVIELTEHALRAAEKAVESVDDSGGEMGDMLERLQDLHHAACRKAKPDPEVLAQRLFEWELHTDRDTFSGAAVTYADVFGRKGLAVYRQLAEQQWAHVPHAGSGGRNPERYGKCFRITQIMEALARQSGDVEAMVAIQQRDLSSGWAYLQIAETYRQAKQHDLALEWAERGVKTFPHDRDARLREFLAAEYHRRKRHDEAMALVWADFEAAPGLGQYQTLRSHADRSKQWPLWRERALGLVREQIACTKRDPGKRRWGNEDHSELVRILWWERDFEAAWREARTGGCDDGLWRELAVWREKEHPQDAIPIYWKEVELALDRKNNDAYREAVRLLRKIRQLLQRVGQEVRFAGELAALRATHKAKRNFTKLLDHAKWA